jgi:hypothetical protein
MKTYSVRVSRRDHGWDAGIDGVGWIRVERLTGVERAVRAHLAVLGFSDASTAPVVVDYGPELGQEVAAVREARDAADGWVRYAAERSRELTLRLVAEGLSGAEVAMVLGISPQRVSQLVAPTRKATVDVRESRQRTADELRQAHPAGDPLADVAADRPLSREIAS